MLKVTNQVEPTTYLAALEHHQGSVKTNRQALGSSSQLALVDRVQASASTSNSSSHSNPHLFSEVSNSLSSNLLFLEGVLRQDSLKTSQQALVDSRLVHLDNKIIQHKVVFSVKINQ